MEWKMSDMMEHEEKNTEQRISDPFSWDGHETEAMLACESGNGTAKELVAVVRVRVEGRPEAFYRVKEAAQATNPSRCKSKNNWKTAKPIRRLFNSRIQRHQIHS